MKTALWALLVVTAAGAAFSGVLSYRELFGSTAATCPSPGAPGTVLGYPACIYGFFVFLIALAISVSGLIFGGTAQR